MIWIVFAGLTVVVMAGLLWPVAKSARAVADPGRDAYDRTIFRDQLAELDRDVERGIIAPGEADAARNEISRRLIAAVVTAPENRTRSAPALGLLAVLIVPAIAIPLYLRAGSPGLPDVPLAARLETAEETGDMDALIAKVERHLAGKPDDLEGWKVLVPTYRRAQRWSDAAEAQRNILRLSEPTAANLADYGEALVLANQGLVPADANRLFAAALKTDAKFPKARFYAALALKQEGRADEARTAFEAFLADTPAGAPWRDMLLAEMKVFSARPPALDRETMASAQAMAPEERQKMILAMVDGLEEKLKADGNDLEGWLKLIRARGVLGDREKAKQAYGQAQEMFKNDGRAIAALSGLADEMGLK